MVEARDRTPCWRATATTPTTTSGVDLEQISPHAALAVVAAEDQQFPATPGFDFKSIRKALGERQRGRGVRGASTISQQVAKNLFLWHGRSYVRKGLEAVVHGADRDALAEAAHPRGVPEHRRVRAAASTASRRRSQRFFRKHAARLTRAEAALLAAVLPAPTRFKADAPSSYVRRRQAWIQRQMASLGGSAYISNMD